MSLPRLLRFPALALVIAAALLTAPIGPAEGSSTIVKACVRKGSGQMRILSGAKAQKKCKKGWKKVTWNVTGARGLPGGSGTNGPNGGTGPAGPPQYVKDRNGTALGQFLGVFPQEVPSSSSSAPMGESTTTRRTVTSSPTPARGSPPTRALKLRT